MVAESTAILREVASRSILLMTGPFSADVGVEALRVQLGEVLADAVGASVKVTAAPSRHLLASVARGGADRLMPPAMVQAMDGYGASLLAGSIRAGPAVPQVIFVAAKSEHREPRTRGRWSRGSIRTAAPNISFHEWPARARPRSTRSSDRSRCSGSHDAVAHAVEEGMMLAQRSRTTQRTRSPRAGPVGGWYAPVYPAAMRPAHQRADPGDAVVATREIDERTRQNAAEALTKLHTLPGGSTLLTALFNAARFEATDPARYSVVRRALQASERR
jgi:hypothetical protein